VRFICRWFLGHAIKFDREPGSFRSRVYEREDEAGRQYIQGRCTRCGEVFRQNLARPIKSANGRLIGLDFGKNPTR